MNPNAPEHQPEVMRDVVIIQLTSEKLFSHNDQMAWEINQWVMEGDKLGLERQKYEIAKQWKLDRPGTKPSSTLFAKSLSSSESNSKLDHVLFVFAVDALQLSFPEKRIDLITALKPLAPESGTSPDSTDLYLQFVCDFANQWHSKLTGVDYRSPGTDPMFYCLDAQFYNDIMWDRGKTFAQDFQKTHLTRTQFWKLRYLFIPVSFKNGTQHFFHVALCAISPEARTVDYICSGGDSGLVHSQRRTSGSKSVPTIFNWLAHLLGNDPHEGFLPYEWKLRTDHGYLQVLSRKDCSFYTVTHAMSLAFGWGLDSTKPGGVFPKDHQARMIHRRHRCIYDLKQGFKFYDPNSENGNASYYPLLDTAPSNDKADGYTNLVEEVIDALPTWAANRRFCYINCPSVLKLKQHCKRNERYYPGWDKPQVSGSDVALETFVAWVEEMDHLRKRGPAFGRGKFKPLPYPRYQPPRWIDPRARSPKSLYPDPLWE